RLTLSAFKSRLPLKALFFWVPGHAKNQCDPCDCRACRHLHFAVAKYGLWSAYRAILSWHTAFRLSAPSPRCQRVARRCEPQDGRACTGGGSVATGGAARSGTARPDVAAALPRPRIACGL